ncbi:MAG: hypothetical protein MK108_03710 [Mariniblastus sp.]|nr:hypothetical protein [Mariniblastus sp.]
MKLLSCLLLLIFTCPIVVLGQGKGDQEEGPVGIFESNRQYGEFMGAAKRMAYGEEGNRELRAMIPLLNDIALNRPVGSTSQQYAGQASLMGLIGNPRVREDLEIVDEQYQQFLERAADAQRQVAEQLREMDFSDREGLVRQVRDIQDQTRRELETVLLPHQMDRLRQIRAQSLLRRRTFVEAITSEPMRSELEISNRQAEALQEEAEKLEADIAKQVAELREKARQRLVKTLDRSQQQKIDDLFGDNFDFGPVERRPAKGGSAKGKGGQKGGKGGK